MGVDAIKLQTGVMWPKSVGAGLDCGLGLRLLGLWHRIATAAVVCGLWRKWISQCLGCRCLDCGLCARLRL